MTVQKHLAQEPFLTTDDAKTGIYLIPNGKRGWTSFPVTDKVAVQKTRTLDNGTKEQYEDYKLQLKEGTVLVTPEQYEGLQAGTHVWENGTVVEYVEPVNVTQAKALLEQVEQTKQQVAEAHAWLKARDYIGVKIAQVMLVGTNDDLASLKTQYAETIAEAQTKRDTINELEAWLKTNEATIAQAQTIIANET